MNQTKSEVWLSGADSLDNDLLGHSFMQMAASITRAFGSMRVMDAACQGEFESQLGPMQALAKPAAERLQNAGKL